MIRADADHFEPHAPRSAENTKPMPVEKYSRKIVDVIGNIERFIGVCFAVGGSLTALGAWPTSVTCTGVEAGLSAMGLMGSLTIGGILFYAGRGLLNRSQMSRRIQIGFALVVAYSGSFSIFTYGERFIGAVVLCLAMAFVILMFLPSIRTQFVVTSPEE